MNQNFIDEITTMFYTLALFKHSPCMKPMHSSAYHEYFTICPNDRTILPFPKHDKWKR